MWRLGCRYSRGANTDTNTYTNTYADTYTHAYAATTTSAATGSDTDANTNWGPAGHHRHQPRGADDAGEPHL